MTSFDPNKYDPSEKRAHQFFENTKTVSSPLLGEIHFNSDGFMHLIYDSDDRKQKRDWKNRIKRFELLPLIPHVLKSMTHCQEYSERLQTIGVKMNKQRMYTVKKVKYWGFVAVVKNYHNRIKIVVRQVGEGQIHFWSVIPYWNTKHYKDVVQTIMHEGDLERD